MKQLSVFASAMLVLAINTTTMFAGMQDLQSQFTDVQSIQQLYHNNLLAMDQTKLLSWLKTLNISPLILLDVTSKARIVEVDEKRCKYNISIDIIYGIDQGYGYSTGPFRGTLYLIPVDAKHLHYCQVAGTTGNYYCSELQQIISRDKIARALGPNANVDEFINKMKEAEKHPITPAQMEAETRGHDPSIWDNN